MLHYIIESVDLTSGALIQEELLCSINPNQLRELLEGKTLNACDGLPPREVKNVK